MKTDFEKDNVDDYQCRKLLKIIDPYCYKFNDVAGLMKNCLTQHDIIHALLKILKDRFNCTVEANTKYVGGGKGTNGYLLDNLTYTVDIPRIEANVYMIKDYDDPLNIEKEKKNEVQ